MRDESRRLAWWRGALGFVGMLALTFWGLGCPASQQATGVGVGVGGGGAKRAGPAERIGVKRKAGVVTSHPRLWLTAADLPRLRSWAVDSNPFWKNGLKVAAAAGKQVMDNGSVPGADPGHPGATQHPTEMYAQIFAFMSLVHPQQSVRDDYGQRARTLLMAVMNEAAKGAGSGRFRASTFSTYDRSRWHGEAFPLVVDWIYPRLSASDKATIRKVFERWVDENMNANTTGHNHPTPVGLTNDPKLVSDTRAVRWSANNYYTAHMRNLGLMGLALDPADDVNGKLKKGFESSVGAFLYVNDHLRRNDSKGGLSPEGPYYAPESVSYITQLLLALYTSGNDDPQVHGKQVSISQAPYWDEIFKGWFHMYPPAPRIINNWEGPVWEAAWSGDGSVQSIRDAVALWGPLGVYHYYRGDKPRLDHVRWVQEHFPRGGKSKLLERAARSEPMIDAIFYFLLFGPGYQSPADPRPTYAKTHLAEGIGHLFSRTGWDDKASFFRFICGYNTIDHQHCDGNHFGFWRKGEWLTRDRTGYADTNPHSQYHNTLSIQNDPPATSEGWVQTMAQTGSQWMGMPSGDGTIVRHSEGKSFLYALGDATKLYNSSEMKANDVKHASRSVVWLKPDHVVFFDRAETGKTGRFKRLWQQLPSNGTKSGQRVTAKTPKGQQVFLTTLLPASATINVQVGGGQPAPETIMTHRVSVASASPQKREYFLHVLQGADAGANADAASAIKADEGAYRGAVVKGVAVLFPEVVGAAPSKLRYTVPGSVGQQIICGLTPGAAYSLTQNPSGGNIEITVTPGGQLKADSGGVLTYPEVAPPPRADGGLPPPPDGGPGPGPDGSGPAGDGPAGPFDGPSVPGTEGGATNPAGPSLTGGCAVASRDVAPKDVLKGVGLSALAWGLIALGRFRRG